MSAADLSEPARQPAGARQAALRAVIQQKGFVSVARIAEVFGVSEMTIRRDLHQLEKQGGAIRTHGGAVAPDQQRGRVIDIDEPPFDARSRKNAEAKEAIGRAAARLVLPGETIGLDVGTSTCQLAQSLTERSDLRIFTNNLRAALVLGNTANKVYLPGGQVRSNEMSVYGSMAIAQLRNYWLDHVFIGVSGVTEAGCFDYSLEDTEVKQVYIDRARQVIVLCDASKFDHMSVVKVCALAAVDLLVTDAPPPRQLAQALERESIQLLIADPL